MADILFDSQAWEVLRLVAVRLWFWWFLWLPLGLFWIFKDAWRNYVRAHFIFTKKYVLLEVKIPRDVAKSPKAMESILAGIHGTRRLGNLVEQWWDGWVTAWFSLEVVGDEKGVHFYIWTNEFFKKLLEAQIYAQYPAAEIKIVEDYTSSLPAALPNEEWNIWGSEFILTKPDAYPIRTYEDFVLEDISSKEEERKIDPLAALIEYLGSLKGSEKFWMQMLVQPAGDKWKKEGEALIAKMIGRKTELKPSWITVAVDAIQDLLEALGILGAPEASPGGAKKSAEPSRMLYLSPGEVEVVKALERNMAKIGFEVGIRWIYLARRDEYNILAVPAIMGVFKQFASQNLNGFALNKSITTSVDYWLVERRSNWRKRRLHKAYILRSMFHLPYKARSKPFVLSSSELATVYHFPGMVAGAPSMERIEAKHGAPPPNLPMQSN